MYLFFKKWEILLNNKTIVYRVIDMNEYKIYDWGSVTPELYNPQTNDVIYVFNHNIKRELIIKKSIKFAIGRLKWYKYHLPKVSSQKIVYDDRGKDISTDVKKEIRDKFKNIADEIMFMSEMRC